MDTNYYDFKEHISSIEWIHQLPSGLVNERIDIRYSAVCIKKLGDGYQITIGPKNSDLGGDAIIILLDKDHRLKNYEIERIEPLPVIKN